MIQELSDKFWQAEARNEETKRFIRDIKRITRRKFSAEEKIRIVLEGFRRDTPIRDLCRREGIRPGTYYAWLKDFMEAGKERLAPFKVAGAWVLNAVSKGFGGWLGLRVGSKGTLTFRKG